MRLVPVAIMFGLLSLAWSGVIFAASASYRVDVDASPYPLSRLLNAHLDIVRFAARDDITNDQLDFLVTATPQQVRDLAETEGYFSPVINTDVKEVKGKKEIHVHVEPGPRTTISSVNLVFVGPVSTEAPQQERTARSAFSLHEGDAFSQSGWDAAKSAALKALQTRRYLGARIVQSKARIDPQTHDARLSVTFDSGPTFTLGPLSVSGLQRYPEKITRNMNPLTVGEIYDEARMAELQRLLQNTPYYASVAIDVDDTAQKAADTPVHIKINEYPYHSFRGGVGYASDTGAHIQGSYTYLDTFGAAWPFQVQGRVDQIQKYGQVQLSMPPDTHGWTSSALASYTSTNVSDTNIYSMRAGVQRSRTSQDYDYSYGLFFYQDRLTQNVGLQTVSHALMPSWSWTRRNVDDPLFPRSGNVIHAEAGFAVKDLASSQSFMRGYLRAQQYLPVGHNDLVLFRTELGGVFTSGGSRDIPASLLFRAGGSNSVRGYSYEGLGNNVDGSTLPAKYLFTGTAEYQHWFGRNWGAATFFDLGTATDTWGEKVLYSGVGLGVRWRSPVGPVNFDLAYGLRNHSVRPYLALGIAF